MKPIDRPELEELERFNTTSLRVILEDMEHELELIDPEHPQANTTQNELRFRIRRVKQQLKKRARMIILPTWPTDGQNSSGATYK